jgi:hypothetical protein
MALPMSLAGIDWPTRGGAAIKPTNAMPEQKKTSKTKTVLPCQWLEEDGFEIKPAQESANKLPVIPDTAFLLKHGQPPRPPRSPNS